MTSAGTRLTVIAATVLVFLVLVAAIAIRPWQSAGASSAAPDPRLAALDRREAELRARADEVQQTLDKRFAEYRHALTKRKAAVTAARREHKQAVAEVAAQAQVAAAAPIVRVVSLPPVAQTRSS